MEFKSITASIKEIDGRTVVGFPAVIGNIDSGRDRIHKGAFKKTIKEGAKRVRHLWQHDFEAPPIAKIVSLEEVSRDDLPEEIIRSFPDAVGGLKLTREYLHTPRAEEVFQGIVSGAISEMSFGYDPVKFDFEEVKDVGVTRNLREVRLWDTSDVNWGMNPATIASSKAIAFEDTGIVSDVEYGNLRLEHFTDLLYDSLPDFEKQRIASHFAWGAGEFESLKFGHHQALKTGVGPAVWAGVEQSMKDLMVDSTIPDSDRKAVYDHLAAHYKQFDKEAPSFPMIQLVHSAACVGDIEPALAKTGRVLSSRNLAKLKDALAVLTEILLAAEPPDDDEKIKALTASVLTRLAIAERDPIFIFGSNDGH